MSVMNHANRSEALPIPTFPEATSMVSMVDSALRWTGIYLLQLLAATLGVVVATGFVLNILLKPLEQWLGHSTLFSVARGPYYAFPIALALVAGFVSGLRLEGNHRYWVWLLPALYTAVSLILWKNSGVSVSNSWATAINHFFAGEPPYFPEQGVTVPLYTSVAYSVGAILQKAAGIASRSAKPLR